MGEYGEGRPGVFLITELGGGGGYERGRVFKLDDPADIDTIVARRAAARRPYVPEPALAALADLWAKITGPGGDDGQDQGADGRGRRRPEPAGQLIEGTGQITAKIGQARALAEAGPGPAGDPPGDGRARRGAARRAAPPVLRPAYTDVDHPRRRPLDARWRCWPPPAARPPARPPRRSARASTTVSTRLS